MSKDALGQRMKEQYEHRSRTYLMRRCPTIIRLDGKAFHTYTRGLNKPFDIGLIEDMVETTKYLCENIQGARLGYCQSDEISILLTDYTTINTDAWFDYNVQKMTSISASLATAKFNQLRVNRELSTKWEDDDVALDELLDEVVSKYKLAFFDSRVFQIADYEEVVNYFIWRQQDAVRNSIQMLAQSLYSHKELMNKNSSELQELTFQKGYNWNDLEYNKKRGSCIIKNTYVNDELFPSQDFSVFIENGIYYKIDPIIPGEIMTHRELVNPVIRTKWEAIETPTFSQDRNMILELLKRQD